MNIKESWIRYRNIWTKARKPSKDEFTATTKICLLGIGLVGVLGFAMFMIFRVASIVGGLPL